ncbi:MAG: cytochrome c oxidase subunit 3 [Deltaproteobacteria bacterium]|nr:cytochrome c oxidase subunit 3 [Deltaproteobacteria bacterium]
MWIFLGSELLLFAGLFGLYTVYRTEYGLEFDAGIHHNQLLLGSTNTVVLIVSSFTVAWALYNVRKDKRDTALAMLGITMLLGLAFLVIKGVEYAHHFSEGVFPGKAYTNLELPGHGARMFFTLYYLMTGLHALHMIGGLAVMGWVTHRVWTRRTNRESHTELHLGALYWHLVDSIWIFLWPLFYLTG